MVRLGREQVGGGTHVLRVSVGIQDHTLEAEYVRLMIQDVVNSESARPSPLTYGIVMDSAEQ
jgi:hypothetical protein